MMTVRLWRKRYPGIILSTGVFLLGSCIAAACGWWLYQKVHAQAKADFQHSAERVTAEITRRFHMPLYGLNTIRSIYVGSEKVTRAEFRDAISSLELASEFPGVRGFGYIEPVLREDLASFIAAEQRDEAAQFAIRQLGERGRDRLYVIKFIEPEFNNAGEQGLDIGSERKLREAAERAVDSGEPIMSDAVTLMQDKQGKPGVLLYQPVYARNSTPDDRGKRRDALSGLAYASIVLDELLAGVQAVSPDQVDFAVFDAVAASPADRLVYRTGQHASAATSPGGQAGNAAFKSQVVVQVPGRAMTVQVSSTPQFDAAIPMFTPWLASVGGMLFSGILAALLWQLETGRRRAEKAAQAMTVDMERLAQVVKHTANAVSICDRQLRITWMNEGFTRISGYAGQEALGKRVCELLGHDLNDPAVRRIEAAAEIGVGCQVELHNHGKDGRQYWTDTEFQPLRDAQGYLTGFMQIDSDISARRLARDQLETALRDNAALLSALNMHAIISVADRAGRITEANDAFCRISGYRREELLGQNHRIINSGVQAPAFWVGMWRTISGGIPWRGEVCNRAKDGTQYWVDTFIAPFKGADGHIEKYISIRTDITPSKIAGRELVRATREAQEASRAKSQFLANMSHEIRTPMNAILGMLTLLRKTGLTARQTDYADKTDSAARALMGLLNDILDISKVEAGKMVLEAHPFQTARLLRELSTIFAASVGPKKVAVLFDIDPALPQQMVGDAMRLQQVLLNLGGNAIKFTEQGQIVLSIRMLQRDADSATLQIAVSDTGIGIAPENQSRIFSGFTQAEASTTRRFGGTGLGLSISHRLVEMMGGELRVDSVLGQGSRFHFTISLPVLPDADRQLQGITRLPQNVIIVEANPVAAELLLQMSRALGWQAGLAQSGRQALEMLQAQAMDGQACSAIFLDWDIPGEDGWQLCGSIRETGAATPVIAMAGAYALEELIQTSQAEQDLLSGCLSKPVTASMLFDALANLGQGQDRPQAAPQRDRDSQRLAGMRLLLAEDNATNQQVARELLEDEGALVQIASHGQEAVEAVALAPFDVVLMDLQMPVMDGLTATRHIRSRLQLQSLPIVAMTANAMSADREACLAAGMNDHVGKPFEFNQLVAVLRKHAGWQDAPHPEQEEPILSETLAGAATVLPSPEAVQAAHRAGVDMHAALERLGGKPAVYRRMLGLFNTELIAMPEQMSAWLSQGDMRVLANLLHTLKGQAATLGISALAWEAEHGEQQLASPNAVRAQELVRQISATIDATAPGLIVLYHALQEGGAETASVEGARGQDGFLEELALLARQLKESDMAATDTVLLLQKKFGKAGGAQLVQMSDAIGQLDFECALRLCLALMESQVE